jgi:sugar phosphate permease
VYGLTQADAGQKSSIFPFIGGVSVLFVGRLSDHVGSSVRLVIAIPLLALAVVALSLIGSRAALDSQITGLILLSGVASLLIGPYSLLAGDRHGTRRTSGQRDGRRTDRQRRLSRRRTIGMGHRVCS